MKMYKVQHRETSCRACHKPVFEDDLKCQHCLIGAPGIDSSCPACGSSRYVYHHYGYHKTRGLLCIAACFPLVMFFPPAPLLGVIFGFIGQDENECICEDCLQGWFPFDQSNVSRFNFEVDRDKSITRKFKEIPKNCYEVKKK